MPESEPTADPQPLPALPEYGSGGLAGRLKTFANVTGIMWVLAFGTFCGWVAYKYSSEDRLNRERQYDSRLEAQERRLDHCERDRAELHRQVGEMFKQMADLSQRSAEHQRTMTLELAKFGEAVRQLGMAVRASPKGDSP